MKKGNEIASVGNLQGSQGEIEDGERASGNTTGSSPIRETGGYGKAYLPRSPMN